MVALSPSPVSQQWGAVQLLKKIRPGYKRSSFLFDSTLAKESWLGLEYGLHLLYPNDARSFRVMQSLTVGASLKQLVSSKTFLSTMSPAAELLWVSRKGEPAPC